jgi:hypothetical protein
MIPDPLPFCGDIIEANPIVTVRGEKIGDMGIFSSGFNCYEPGIVRFTNSLRIRPAPSRCRECIACPPSGVLRAKVRGTSAVGRGEPGEKEKENTLYHVRQSFSCHTTSSRCNSVASRLFLKFEWPFFNNLLEILLRSFCQEIINLPKIAEHAINFSSKQRGTSWRRVSFMKAVPGPSFLPSFLHVVSSFFVFPPQFISAG